MSRCPGIMSAAATASMHRAHFAVDRLLHMLRDALDGPARGLAGLELAMENVEQYRAMLQTGFDARDLALAARGAGALTTVNKGLGDMVAASTVPGLEEQAFEVVRCATEACRYLRDEEERQRGTA